MYPLLQWAHSRKAGGMGDGEEQEVTVNSEYRDSLGKDGEEKEAVWRLLKEEGRKGLCETRRARASCHPTSLACSFVFHFIMCFSEAHFIALNTVSTNCCL